MTELVKQIYWVEVLERLPGTLNSKTVIQAYPFPDVEFEPFGFDIELFETQINKISDPITQLATQQRFRFIIDVWHPKNFFRIVRKPWKYS